MRFVVAVLLVLGLAAQAGAREDLSLKRLMAVTGLETLFASTAEGIVAMQNFAEQGDPAYGRHWERVARESYAHAALTQRVAELMDGVLGADEIAAVTGFYGSDLGQRLVARERALHTMSIADYDRALAGAEAIAAALPAGSHRQELHERLYGLGLGALIEEASLEVTRRILLGSALTGVAPGDIEGAAEMEALVEAYLPYYAEQIAFAGRMQAYHIYAPFGDAELEAFADFAATVEGQAFITAATLAIAQSYLEATERFVARLGEMARGKEAV